MSHSTSCSTTKPAAPACPTSKPVAPTCPTSAPVPTPSKPTPKLPTLIKETSPPPPTYEQAQAQLKAFTDAGVPDSVKATAHAAIAAELAKPETAQKLLEEVQALGDSAIKIDQAFERVKIDLGTVDNNNYKDKDGKPLAKLQPTWIGFQQRYIKLLWDSRDTAIKTEAYIKDFVQVILPTISNLPPGDAGALRDAKADLNEFINRTDPNGGVLNSGQAGDLATQHSQAFTDLRRDIAAFRESFETFAQFQEQEINTEILRLQGEITKLEAEVATYRTIVLAMGVALGITVFGAATGAVAALAACGPAGPAVAVGILIIGAIAAISELGVLIAYIVKTNQAQSDLDKAKNDLKDMQNQLETLKRLQALLKAQDADINDICGRLDQFAAIWALVAHDAKLISDELTAAAGSVTTSAFKLRVGILNDSYTALQAGLQAYSTMVDGSGVPKPSA